MKKALRGGEELESEVKSRLLRAQVTVTQQPPFVLQSPHIVQSEPSSGAAGVGTLRLNYINCSFADSNNKELFNRNDPT